MKIDLDILQGMIAKWLAGVIAQAYEIATGNAQDQYLTSAQVCAYLCITKPTLRAWTRAGKLKGLKTSERGRWLYERAEVLAFMARHKKKSLAAEADKVEARKHRRDLYLRREAYMAESGQYISADDFAELLEKSYTTVKELNKQISQ